MFHEHETVVLTHDIKTLGLKEGDVGTVVYTHKNNRAYEVEFVDAEGKTIAVLTLRSEDIRSMKQREILHVRGLDLAARA